MDTFALCGGDATGYTTHQHQVGTYTGKKTEVPREKLSDHEFDKIVFETSARLARSAVRASHYALAASGDDVKVFAPGHAPVGSPTQSPPPPHKLSQPKRPMNAFMVWGQAIRRELHNRYSNVQNALLSKALGRVWKQLDLDEKEPYISRANIIKTNHKRDYPNYRYQPRRIQEKNQQQQQQQRIQSTKALGQQKQTNHLARRNSVIKPSVFGLSQPQAITAAVTPTNLHQYYQLNQQQQQHLQPNQSHSHQRAAVIDNAPKITHHHATASNNFMSSPLLDCNNQQAAHEGGLAGTNMYKSSQYNVTTNSMQLLNINSNYLYAARSKPATISAEETATCYSNYDSSPHYVSSSEASNDNQYHFISDKDLAAAVAGPGQLFNTTDQQRQQQRPKLYIDTAGQVNFETSQQQHVYPVQCHPNQPDHVHTERQNHSQLTEDNSINDHDLSHESTSIANIIPQQSHGTDSSEYQFYRQQHQHHNNSQQQQQQQQQQIEQFEDSSQSYRGYAEQVQSYPLNVCDTRPVINGRLQVITQAPSVTDRAADHVGCQMKRENYHHMYRGYSDELSLV